MARLVRQPRPAGSHGRRVRRPVPGRRTAVPHRVQSTGCRTGRTRFANCSRPWLSSSSSSRRRTNRPATMFHRSGRLTRSRSATSASSAGSAVGGMGVVYEAIQESLGRHVALKLLPHEVMANPKRLERFRREARSAARLHHTNIVPVFGTGHGGRPALLRHAVHRGPPAGRRHRRGPPAAGRPRAGAARPGGRDHGCDRPDDGDVRPPARRRERGRHQRLRRARGLGPADATTDGVRRRRCQARSRTTAGPTGSPWRGSGPRWPTRWPTPTPRVCCTAISNPPTCCWT